MAKGLPDKLVSDIEEVQILLDGVAEPFIKNAGSVYSNISVSDQKKKRKEDALALAQLIYDVYKEERPC